MLIDQPKAMDISKAWARGAAATASPSAIVTRALLAKGLRKQQQDVFAASARHQLGDQKSLSLVWDGAALRERAPRTPPKP